MKLLSKSFTKDGEGHVKLVAEERKCGLNQRNAAQGSTACSMHSSQLHAMRCRRVRDRAWPQDSMYSRCFAGRTPVSKSAEGNSLA